MGSVLCCFLLLALSGCSAIFPNHRPTLTPRTIGTKTLSGETKEPFHYTCEQIISRKPDSACELREEQGSVTVRGLEVKYWYYIRAHAIERSTTEGEDPLERLPLVVIHGGPAASHDYVSTLKHQACHGTPTLLYDQAGAGLSGRPVNTTVADGAPWLLTLEYYPEELLALTQALDMQRFHLLGHSWGGIPAMMFALSYPERVSGLILASTLTDGELYVSSQRRLLHSTLPPLIQDRIRALGAQEAYDSEEYSLLNEYLTGLWTIRTSPMPDCVVRSLELLNTEIYVAMQGPSEFTIGGVLATFNLTGRLEHIGQPTLITHGRHDTMTDPVVCCSSSPDVEVQRNLIPRSRLVTFEHAGHMTMIDDYDQFDEDIQQFILSVETATFQPDTDFQNNSAVWGVGQIRIIFSVAALVLVCVIAALRMKLGRFKSLASQDGTYFPNN